MHWILYIVGGLVAVPLIMALIGLALPRAHVAARTVVFARPPEAVWRALTGLDDHVSWRRGLKQLAHLPPVEGKPSFREHTTHGVLTFIVDAERRDELRITRIDDAGLPFGGRWIYELAPVGADTRLTITEDGFIRNPVFRLLSKTVMREGATLEQFIADLGKHLGVAATAERAAPSRLAS